MLGVLTQSWDLIKDHDLLFSTAGFSSLGMAPATAGVAKPQRMANEASEFTLGTIPKIY